MLRLGEGLQPLVCNIPWFTEVEVLAHCFGIREVAFNAFESPNPVEFLVGRYREQIIELLQWHMPILGEAVSLSVIGFGFSVFEPNNDMDDMYDMDDMDHQDMELSDEGSDSESDMSGTSYRLASSSSSSSDSGYFAY